MKHCTGCGIKRSREHFHKRSASKDCLTARCKRCINGLNRKRYRSDPDFRAQCLRARHQRVRSGVHSEANKRLYLHILN